MKLTYYLPLAQDKSSPSFVPVWSRRRTVQTTFLFVVAISVFLLFEYASYLTETEEDLQDEVEGKVAVDSTLDTFYLQFRPPQPAPLSRKLKPSLSLPPSCLDAHIAKGELCYHPAKPKFDILWTWVNGTDEFLRDAKARIEDDLPPNDPYRPYQPASTWGHVRQFRCVFSSIYSGMHSLLFSGTTTSSGSQHDLFSRTSGHTPIGFISSHPTSRCPTRLLMILPHSTIGWA